MRWMGGITNCLRARELAVIQSKTVKVIYNVLPYHRNYVSHLYADVY